VCGVWINSVPLRVATGLIKRVDNLSKCTRNRNSFKTQHGLCFYWRDASSLGEMRLLNIYWLASTENV
jgi:hypothetical protein